MAAHLIINNLNSDKCWLVYFSIWDEREGRLKADVSDGLDVAMWNNLFILLGL